MHAENAHDYGKQLDSSLSNCFGLQSYSILLLILHLFTADKDCKQIFKHGEKVREHIAAEGGSKAVVNVSTALHLRAEADHLAGYWDS